MEQKINIADIKIKVADYPKSSLWEDLIYEAGCKTDKGSFEETCCFTCDYSGKELEIYFNLNVCGTHHQIKGDYLTPGDSFSDIEYVDITIDYITIDDEKVSVSNTDELIKFIQVNID